MHRRLVSSLIALSLGAGAPVLACAPDAEAPASALGPDPRSEVMIEAYGGWVGVQRLAAECARRGLDTSDAIRRAIEETGTRYETELEEAKRLYEDAANADRRREVDAFVQGRLDAVLKKPGNGIRRECEQAGKDTASLTTHMGNTFGLADSLGAPLAPPAIAEPSDTRP